MHSDEAPCVDFYRIFTFDIRVSSKFDINYTRYDDMAYAVTLWFLESLHATLKLYAATLAFLLCSTTRIWSV